MTHKKAHHKSLEERAHNINSLAASGETDKLLQELNSTKPKELCKLARSLQEQTANNESLPEVKITQEANTREGGPRQPTQLSFEGNFARAQVFSYDVLKQKWYHSELDEKARKIELYAADQKPGKVIEILNSVKSRNFSDLERKLNEQTSQFTIDSETLPKVEASRHGLTDSGIQPIEFTLYNKNDHHVHVYEYDASKHKWQENKHLSDNKSLQRLGTNWQSWLSETKRMFGQATKDVASGSDKCYRFFIKMEGITNGLKSISGGPEANREKR